MDKIGQTGIEKFCADLGINPMDPVILVVSFKMGAKEMVPKFSGIEVFIRIRDIIRSRNSQRVSAK